LQERGAGARRRDDEDELFLHDSPERRGTMGDFTRRRSRAPSGQGLRRERASVAGHGGVDLLRPRFDTADQVVHVLEAAAQKVLSGLLRALAVMAVDDEDGVAIEALDEALCFLVDEARTGD